MGATNSLDLVADFGGVGDGATDNSAAFAAAVAFIVASPTVNTLTVPKGNFRMSATPVNPGINIEGENSSSTSFQKAYNGGAGLLNNGFAGLGGIVRGIALTALAGFAPGQGLVSVAGPDAGGVMRSPDYMKFIDIVVSGPGGWANPVLINGQARMSGGLWGVRDQRYIACDFSNASAPQGMMALYAAVGAKFIGCGSYIGGFPPANDGLTLNNCDSVKFNGHSPNYYASGLIYGRPSSLNCEWDGKAI